MPRPTIAPTAVIDVETGTPKKFEINSASPAKKSTTMLAASVNWLSGTIPSLIVVMTFRPTVHPPTSANAVNSPAAVAFPTIRLPTAGPNATPVEEPPMLYPTNTATTTPTASNPLRQNGITGVLL